MTKHKNRTDDILNAAEMLFYQKGYDKTTINDILNALSISKGAFYHYFKSKEEVMEAIVMRAVDSGINEAEKIQQDESLTVFEKILRIILVQQPNAQNNKEPLMQELHQASNAKLHEKLFIELIRRLTPVLTAVVEEGIKKGVMNTPYPQESIEFILCAALTMFDLVFSDEDFDQLKRKIEATLYHFELCLGTQKGSFDCMLAVFDNLKSRTPS